MPSDLEFCPQSRARKTSDKQGSLALRDTTLFPPESEYRFKHALIQDAAYENLLKSRRQALHRRAGEVLRDQFAATDATEPELLARHFTQAGLTDAAIEWWGKAGDQALRRSGFQEAIAHLGKAIEMADNTGEGTSAATTVSASQRLKLQTDLAQALMWSRGFGSEESTPPSSAPANLRQRSITRPSDSPFTGVCGPST
jgi:predicted ATPase